MGQTISMLARSEGVNTDTIRYYERLGLLSPSERTVSGYRIYDEAAAQRLRLIRQAKSVGLRLNQIGEMLRDLDRGACPCPDVDALLAQRIAAIEEEMSRLAELRAAIAEVRHILSTPCSEAGLDGADVLLRRLRAEPLV